MADTAETFIGVTSVESVSNATGVRRPFATFVTMEWVLHAGANVGLAALFISRAGIPRGGWGLTSVTDLAWSLGMLLTAVFCLLRPPPKAVITDWRAMVSGTASILLPAMMVRSTPPTLGPAYAASAVLAVSGVSIGHFSRLYLGRSFGVLPANRGIVTGGPYKVVRHPVYVGWTMLALGCVMAYPDPANLAMLTVSVPFLFWRIRLEEEVLGADPKYCAYRERVRYRLIPGIY